MRLWRRKLLVEAAAGGFLPARAHGDDAGFDLAIPHALHVAPGHRVTVDFRIRVLVPRGFAGLILPRSSLTAEGIDVLPGVIDAGYTGFIKATVANRTRKDASLVASQRIAQLVVLPLPLFKVERGAVRDAETERGTQGFGSTGRRAL